MAPLRLGFSPFVNPELLEFFRDGYASLFPDCPIHLSGGNFLHMLQRLEQASLDGALLPMPIDGPDWVIQRLARDPLVVCMRTDDALARAPEVSISNLSAKLKIFRDPEIHPTAHDRLVEMLMEVGIDPEASCLAATPADIQWMVRAGYGVALVDQRTILDSGLTTRPIAGISWTADTAFVHHKKGSLGSAVSSSFPSAETCKHARQEHGPPKARDHPSIKSSCLIKNRPFSST